jgi:hypothetical protein
LARFVSCYISDAANKIRDAVRSVAGPLGLESEFKQLDKIISALLGTQRTRLSAPAAIARAARAGRMTMLGFLYFRPWQPSSERIRSRGRSQIPMLTQTCRHSLRHSFQTTSKEQSSKSRRHTISSRKVVPSNIGRTIRTTSLEHIADPEGKSQPDHSVEVRGLRQATSRLES